VPQYNFSMKTLTVRLPELLVAEIELESRERGCSKSDIVRGSLRYTPARARRRSAPLDAIDDLVGSVDGLPTDLSKRKKRYLKATGYGRKRRVGSPVSAHCFAAAP
jgi:Arc/MetJ-type ribon-helix-helix transcriptional regulator